jgi:hypothetical protein
VRGFSSNPRRPAGGLAKCCRFSSDLGNPAALAFANHQEMQSFLTAIFKRSQTAAAYAPAIEDEKSQREDREPALKENKGD